MSGVETVLVEWVIRGNYFVEGTAHRRVRGDEDLMNAVEARKLVRAGYVRISSREVPTITFESVKEVR